MSEIATSTAPSGLQHQPAAVTGFDGQRFLVVWSDSEVISTRVGAPIGATRALRP